MSPDIKTFGIAGLDYLQVSFISEIPWLQNFI